MSGSTADRALDEAHLDHYRRLGAIHGRHDARHHRRQACVGQRVELHLARLVDGDPGDARLGDVGFDLQRLHVGDRDHRALRLGGGGERRDVVADVGVLGEDHGVERRADQRLLDTHLGAGRFACADAATTAFARRRRAPPAQALRRIVLRARDEFLRQRLGQRL
jgi:hypothetical protein